MFYHIEGKVTDVEPTLVVIDCGGVGYALNASLNTISRVSLGERAKLYVSEAIGESNFDLYGFYSKEEKRCFEMLTSVSGIGPKAALSILSYNTPDDLALAIINGNDRALTVAPGVGKKIAQRVILELKDKVSKGLGSASEIKLPAASVSAQGGVMNDVMTALAVLGYSGSDVAPALKSLDTDGMTAEQIIKAVLKQMVR